MAGLALGGCKLRKVSFIQSPAVTWRPFLVDAGDLKKPYPQAQALRTTQSMGSNSRAQTFPATGAQG